MSEYSAHYLANRTWESAEALQACLDPADESSRTLTRADHAALLLRMQEALEELARGINFIAQATDRRATGRLEGTAAGLWQVVEHLQNASAPLYRAEDEAAPISSAAAAEPGTAAAEITRVQAAVRLAAESFSHPVQAGLVQTGQILPPASRARQEFPDRSRGRRQ
ncbi:MAG: hypothetical protein ACRDRJ_11200 [Streptosporangiaceae bacterium]